MPVPGTAIYIALHKGTSLVGRLIRWQTRGEYSHASIILNDGRHVEAREGKGVVLHPEFTPAKGEAVDIFLVELASPAQLYAIEEFLNGELGAPYDWGAVFKFVTRRTPSKASERKWFCSELVYSALRHAGIEPLRDTQPWEVHPSLLARSPFLKRVFHQEPIAA